MPRRGALRRAGAARPADVPEGTAISDQLFELRAHELPGTHVLRFLLQPDDVADRGIASEHLVERDLRERIQLFDAADRDIGGSATAVAGDEIDVNLAAAQDETLDAARVSSCVLVVNDR